MKLKRILAVAMATTMVLGMSMTALAADGDASGTDTVDGTGTSEGHVEQKHFNVVLPTATETTFAYKMDPERLIQTTNAQMYDEGSEFPDAETDTGVYFLTGEKTYANTSNDLEIVNKSSADVKVDVKVKITAGAKDPAIATAALTGEEEAATLYLAAQVGEGEGKETKILSATEQTVSKKLPGNPDNYEIIVDETDSGKVYAYKQKTTGLTAWKSLKFNVTGAVTKDLPVAADQTAPKITVTWAFAEPGTDDATPTTGVGEYEDDPGVEAAAISVKTDGSILFKILADSSGVVASKITSVKVNGVAKTFTLTNTKVVNIADVVTDSVNSYTVEVVYDGTKYVKTGTK